MVAGRKLPVLTKVKPGQSMRGILALGPPRGVRAKSVRITVGPGHPQAAR